MIILYSNELTKEDPLPHGLKFNVEGQAEANQI